MKYSLTLLATGLLFNLSRAQEPITPDLLKKIKSDVEINVADFRKTLHADNMSKEEIEFAVDTFRIEETVRKRMDIDFSTQGMNITVNEMADSYDKLMNRYYNRLLKILKPEDKKTLTNAQKAWIAYRDAEKKLIWAMTKDEYSGGGTIQTNIATGSCAELVVNRAVSIYLFYIDVINNKQ